MSFLSAVSTGAGCLSLNEIKSHLILQQHVPEPKAPTTPFPFLKIDEYISQEICFCWWQLDNVLMFQQHDSGVTACGKKRARKATFLNVALFLIPHPPPLHQLATCSEAVLLCTCQGGSLAKTGWMWHHWTHTDSQERSSATSHRKNKMTSTTKPKQNPSPLWPPLCSCCCRKEAKT